MNSQEEHAELLQSEWVAKELFGEMRNSTDEEKNEVHRYIRDISSETTVNFWDLVNMIDIKTIRSGGQTGVDRAALDTAREYGYPIAGWCPKGGWAEDATEPPGILAKYTELKETPLEEPGFRTFLNVYEADATLIIFPEKCLSNGTDMTIWAAEYLSKPFLVVNGDADINEIREWLKHNDVSELNVAGPRESEWGEAYEKTCSILKKLLNER